MNTISTPISDLLTDPANARKHSSKNLEAIKGSLKRFGQQKPIVVDKDGVVIAGNGTLEAARDLGWEKIDVVRSKLKGADRIAFALADNRTTDMSEFDDDILGKQLHALYEDDYEIAEIGFDPDDYGFDTGKEGETEDDAVPDVAENIHNVKLGDIWQLGDHRIMCGDSTSKDDVEKLMCGVKADICFTSPPYNIGDSIRGSLYENDSDNKSDYVGFLNLFTRIALHNSRFVFVNIQALNKNWKDVFIWQHEWIDCLKDVLIWNKKQCPPNIQKGSFNTKFEFVYAMTIEKSNGRNFPCDWQGKYPNVIETESNSGNDFADTHKAGFPVSFPIWLIEKMDFAHHVYEPFSGTGSTIIACEKTKRKCYGMEIDPHYCSVIIERWQQFTGEKAKAISK